MRLWVRLTLSQPLGQVDIWSDVPPWDEALGQADIWSDSLQADVWSDVPPGQVLGQVDIWSEFGLVRCAPSR